jgi:hydroxyethylthiazole kinase-like uncharacterized protein yjeF
MPNLIGVDLVSVARIQSLLERRPGFATRCFTTAEQARCEGRPERWASRWAAKEAVRKLAVDLGRPLPDWRAIEVVQNGDGVPRVAVADWNVAISLSLTHDAGTACAVATTDGNSLQPYVSPSSPLVLPERPAESNKGTFGRVLVVAGSKGLAGAAHFCSQAAARSGAGLVTVLVPDDVYDVVATMSPDVMVIPVSSANDEIFSRCNALIVGPGLGQSDDAVKLMMWSMKAAHVPTVVDADALNIAAARGMDWKSFSQPIVITPHPGEMSRLAGLRIAEIQQRRGKVAAEYAQRHDVTVVLKDSTTAMADPSGKVIEHSHPLVALATGGTGDVLSGLIGGFLAQGLAPLEAAYAGVVIHSEAGADVEARLGRAGAVASDVVHALPLAQERQRRRLERVEGALDR